MTPRDTIFAMQAQVSETVPSPTTWTVQFRRLRVHSRPGAADDTMKQVGQR